MFCRHLAPNTLRYRTHTTTTSLANNCYSTTTRVNISSLVMKVFRWRLSVYFITSISTIRVSNELKIDGLFCCSSVGCASIKCSYSKFHISEDIYPDYYFKGSRRKKMLDTVYASSFDIVAVTTKKKREKPREYL